jgi:hypothetical protein
MIAVVFKLLLTYIVVSVVGGFTAAAFGCSDLTVTWLLIPPALLVLGIFAITGLSVLWSL